MHTIFWGNHSSMSISASQQAAVTGRINVTLRADRVFKIAAFEGI